ncbi:MAG: M18 family aminopeptidase [Clostridia bacterium]|nr:M18 family aminopeptidase [Clostridia bacterium]
MKLKFGDITNFIEFLDKTPTPFHVSSELIDALTSSGFKKITLTDMDKAERGRGYYVTQGDTAVAAFFTGPCEPSAGKGRIRIGAAHMDYPVLKIKTSGLRKGNGVLRMNVEMYGGAIVHPWMDRALKLSGRVFFRADGELRFADVVDFGKRFVIPNPSIHMNHGVNDGARFSIQNQLLPFFGLDNDEGEDVFAKMIAEKASEVSGISGILPSDIMSFDLSLTVADGASLCGASEEFILAQGLDDRGMVHSLFTGFLADAEPSALSDCSSDIRLAFAFNHEECGSQTDVGARSAFAVETVKAIAKRFFPEEHILDVTGRSFLLSADMGHATHPSYPELYDGTQPVILGKGVALKRTWNQSYSTEAEPLAEFAFLCEENNIPFQRFSNNSDSRGGGTIGPMLSAALGIKTCDIGTPLLAMHSPKELGSVADHLSTEEMFKAFFK